MWGGNELDQAEEKVSCSVGLTTTETPELKWTMSTAVLWFKWIEFMALW